MSKIPKKFGSKEKTFSEKILKILSKEKEIYFFKKNINFFKTPAYNIGTK